MLKQHNYQRTHKWTKHGPYTTNQSIKIAQDLNELTEAIARACISMWLEGQNQ